MGGPRATARPPRPLLAGPLVALAAWGCAGAAPGPEARLPETPPADEESGAAPTAGEQATEPAAGGSGAAAEAPPITDEVIVIRGPGDPATEEPDSLYEAAAAARARRLAEGRPPVAVITNESLSEWPRSVPSSPPDPSVEAEEAAVPSVEDLPLASQVAEPDAAEEPAEESPEEYWRRRAREVRQRWREAADRIEELEARVAQLRYEFYAQDDFAYRDSQIRPAWDRALDELAEARREAEAGRARVAALMVEGRRAGALPGWLREAIDLEPLPEPQDLDGVEREPSEHTIIEPPEAAESEDESR